MRRRDDEHDGGLLRWLPLRDSRQAAKNREPAELPDDGRPTRYWWLMRYTTAVGGLVFVAVLFLLSIYTCAVPVEVSFLGLHHEHDRHEGKAQHALENGQQGLHGTEQRYQHEIGSAAAQRADAEEHVQ